VSKEPNLLRTDALAVGYGGVALCRDINLSVHVGEIVGIIGTNGCGKSTLLRTIAGMIPPLSGSIELHGRDIHRVPAWRRAHESRIGYLPQTSKNFPGLSVRENLHLALWHSREGRAGREARIEQLLAHSPFSALRDYLDDSCSYLSGGQDMLLSLAKCLLRRSTLLLLDEPSAGLSEAHRSQVIEILRPLVQDKGMLLIEQSLNTVFSLADTVYIFRGYSNARGEAGLPGTFLEKVDDRQRVRLRDSYENGELEGGVAEVSALFS
jgi:branched-chain amino acid transport system ATP-binding protein